MDSWITELFSRVGTAAIAASFLASILPLLYENAAKYSLRARAPAPLPPPVTINDAIDNRLNEARQALQRYKNLGTINWWASTSLTFGEYVIGGVLATSFAQESLSARMVGWLGVSVLVASLIKQQFRPELALRGARYRVFKIGAFIRNAEDKLTELRSPGSSVNATTVLQALSEGLAQIDELDVEGLEKSPQGKT